MTYTFFSASHLYIGSMNVSELSRTELIEMLRWSLDEQDEIAIYEQYSHNEIDEDVARVLLGDKIDQMEAEKDAFESALVRDTSAFLADSDGE
jgi:hypothetical protein